MSSHSIGDMVEFYCGRCRLNLNGNVTAVIDGEVMKVTCRTCRFTVQYKPMKSEEELRAQKLKRAFAGRDKKQARMKGQQDSRTTAAGGPEVTRRWREMTEDADALYAPRYAPEKSFDEGDVLIHKQYGLGVVTQVVHEGAFVAIFRNAEVPLEMNAVQETDDED